ncbi:response regulator [Desulfoplanes formicivorans]|uniref:Chemotaxis protein CheY n=1 Tax=Desulfoplanes formicivorans TaxID=1592317 RepID=A0A194AJ23_9BACT|nr:response regulator [Desulfoplanes formicivorans]GAU09235.1 chemotaxis protein CheY [Desulfoplanes formicivorans]
MDAIRVLIVDDEPDLLETMVKRLNRRGLEVTGVDNGEKCLEYLRTNKTDVVVLDVKMPGRDGLEILEEIRKMHPFVQVLMLTGHASVRSGERGMALGAFDYMMKPVSIDELLEKIRQAWIKTRSRS